MDERQVLGTAQAGDAGLSLLPANRRSTQRLSASPETEQEHVLCSVVKTPWFKVALCKVWAANLQVQVVPNLCSSWCTETPATLGMAVKENTSHTQ